MSETAPRMPCCRPGVPSRARASGAMLLAVPAALALSADPARADACPLVAEGVVLCTADTEWAHERIERYEDVTVWESEDYFIEFNPALTEAAGDGPADAALDRLIAALLEGDDAPEVTSLQRDAFQAGATRVERSVYRIVEEGVTYLGGVMLSDFPDGAATRVGWSVGSFGEVSLDDLLGVIDATAAGLGPATEN